MADFHGWNAGALWDDCKVYLKHGNEIERLALVGERKWQEWMDRLVRPFLPTDTRYFDHAQASEARRWILEECLNQSVAAKP